MRGTTQPSKSIKGNKRMMVYSEPILMKREHQLLALTRQAFWGKNPEKISIYSEVLIVACNERIPYVNLHFPLCFPTYLINRILKL